jgi:hypothetical protein
MNNVGFETSRNFRYKMKENLKEKINEYMLPFSSESFVSPYPL